MTSFRSKPTSRRPNRTNARWTRIGTSIQAWLEAYFALQVETFKDSFHRLTQTPLASTLTVLVITIALTLPTGFRALVKNAQQAGASLEAISQISLFLKPELSNETGRKVAEKLKKYSQIAEAGLITKEAGLKELRTYSGFGDALRALDANPLPAVIGIKPKDTLADPEAVEKLLTELRALPEADFVQLDMQWLHKLRAMLAVAERVTVVFSVLLSLGVLFIVGNTIRLELQNRREEIAVARLLGATNRFIRRPFLYAGFWYGLLGGGGAWLMVNLLLLILRGPTRQLAELYGSPYRLSFLSLAETELLVGSSVVLGIAGALAVVAYHLRKLDPG